MFLPSFKMYHLTGFHSGISKIYRAGANIYSSHNLGQEAILKFSSIPHTKTLGLVIGVPAEYRETKTQIITKLIEEYVILESRS